MQNTYIAPPQTSIGHVHLKVANIDRALKFYRDLLGFQIIDQFGEDAVFLSAGGYHHHIALNTWHSKDQPPAPKQTAGLYHLAILYPERKDLSVIVRRVLEADIPLQGAADHGVSEAVYINDPDQNGVELYWDKPRSDWPKDAKGYLEITNDPLDINELLTLSEPKEYSV